VRHPANTDNVRARAAPTYVQCVCCACIAPHP
jgi:hypothetical protein